MFSPNVTFPVYLAEGRAVPLVANVLTVRTSVFIGNDLISSIKISTSIDLLRDDLFNISNEGIQRLILFEKEKHQYLNALLNKNIYRDDKYMTNIRMINFKFIVAGLGMFFALVWFTLFMFIEVPPENAKFIDAGIGMLTSLVGCTIYGYFRDNKNSKE